VVREARHVAHVGLGTKLRIARSPGLTIVTPSPTAWTVPEPSWPSTAGRAAAVMRRVESPRSAVSGRPAMDAGDGLGEPREHAGETSVRRPEAVKRRAE